MKLQVTLFLGAACALTGAANAQTIDNKGGQVKDVSRIGPPFAMPSDNDKVGIGLRDIPKIGQLFRSPALQLPNETNLFGPQMPPIPTLDSKQAAGTHIRVLQTEQGEVFQAEVVRQSMAEVLKKVTALMGVRAVIDPELEKQRLETKVFRGRNFDDLLSSLDSLVERVISPAGTYFFAAKARATGPIYFEIMPDGTWRRRDDLQSPNQPKAEREQGPFRFGPNDTFSTPKPQPEWEKREFNGREFYYIPAPNSAQSQEATP